MTFMVIGDNVIEYNTKFRLYITSKLRNPHYSPEIFNKVTIINFALTVEGLEDRSMQVRHNYNKYNLFSMHFKGNITILRRCR